MSRYENILNRDMMYFASFFNSILTNHIVKIRLGFILFCCYNSRTLLSTCFLLPDIVYGFIQNGMSSKKPSVKSGRDNWNNFRKSMSGRGYSIKALGILWKINKLGIDIYKLKIDNIDRDCLLCMDTSCNFVNLGCGHELCLPCFGSFVEKCVTRDCCPFCRAPIFIR